MYTFYILYSETLESYYIGFTNSIDRRLAEHNRKKRKYTDRGIPWVLVHTEEFKTKEEAMLREKYVKAKKSKTFIIELISSC